MVEWLLNSQLQCWLGWQHLVGLGNVTQDVSHALNQRPIYGAISTINKMHGFDYVTGMALEVNVLTMTPSARFTNI